MADLYELAIACINMLTTPKGYWQHALRAGARQALWAEAWKTRPDLDGIQTGVDCSATCHQVHVLRCGQRRASCNTST